MPNSPLKYIGYTIACQEVPDEVSIVFNISDCPYKCRGCHSQYLWEYVGEYISEDIESVLSQYDGLATCVCMMGGDQNLPELKLLLEKCKSYGFKTCIYSGSNDVELFRDMYDLIDYLKIGEYKEELGGLDSKETNQRFYKKNNLNEYEDITYLFQNYKLIL